MHVVLTTILLQFFFLAGTIDSLNRTRGKQNLHDWYVCFHVVIVINIEKSCRDLTHTWKIVCMHVQVWTLFHVTNQQSGHNQPPCNETSYLIQNNLSKNVKCVNEQELLF